MLKNVSDTSACVLLFLFYFLVQNQSLQFELYKEIACTKGDWNSKRLEELPLLKAMIKETMRLYPILATSGLRTVGPSGLRVGNNFVPPGVTIAMPMYSFGRRKFPRVSKTVQALTCIVESCYERAHEFLPER